MCRDNVEGLYYNFGDRGVYDIRHPYADPTPADYFVDYVNLASVQAAIGVVCNFASMSERCSDCHTRTQTIRLPTTKSTLLFSRLETLAFQTLLRTWRRYSIRQSAYL